MNQLCEKKSDVAIALFPQTKERKRKGILFTCGLGIEWKEKKKNTYR
jgi:hypothetical protein